MLECDDKVPLISVQPRRCFTITPIKSSLWAGAVAKCEARYLSKLLKHRTEKIAIFFESAKKVLTVSFFPQKDEKFAQVTFLEKYSMKVYED